MGVDMCIVMLMGMGLQNVYRNGYGVGDVDKEVCLHGVTGTN